MSFGYSTNQYESAFKAKPLQNWHTLTRFFRNPYPKTAKGFSQQFANDRGHLLPIVPRSSESPWGTFMSTWDMPLRIPPCHPKYTGRSEKNIQKLAAWRKHCSLQAACNGFLEYPTSFPTIPGDESVRPDPPSPAHSTPSNIDDYSPTDVGRPGFTPGPHGPLVKDNLPRKEILPPIKSRTSNRSVSRVSKLGHVPAEDESLNSEEWREDAARRSASRISQRDNYKQRKASFYDRYTEQCLDLPRRTHTRKVLKKKEPEDPMAPKSPAVQFNDRIPMPPSRTSTQQELRYTDTNYRKQLKPQY